MALAFLQAAIQLFRLFGFLKPIAPAERAECHWVSRHFAMRRLSCDVILTDTAMIAVALAAPVLCFFVREFSGHACPSVVPAHAQQMKSAALCRLLACLQVLSRAYQSKPRPWRAVRSFCQCHAWHWRGQSDSELGNLPPVPGIVSPFDLASLRPRALTEPLGVRNFVAITMPAG